MIIFHSGAENNFKVNCRIIKLCSPCSQTRKIFRFPAFLSGFHRIIKKKTITVIKYPKHLFQPQYLDIIKVPVYGYPRRFWVKFISILFGYYRIATEYKIKTGNTYKILPFFFYIEIKSILIETIVKRDDTDLSCFMY